MELIYAWIGNFRNYNNQSINFTDKFNVNYYQIENKIEIEQNNYGSLYPDHIKNLNVVVGKNSVGKTNLLDLLGRRWADRNKNNEEYEVKYKRKFRSDDTSIFNPIIDIQEIIEHYSYFLIFYLGKENGEDLYCIEGNTLGKYKELFKDHKSNIDHKYFEGKHWFSILCTYDNYKLVYQRDLEQKKRSRLAIISLRGNLNPDYYDTYSTDFSDESKIMIPRRVGMFETRSLRHQIKMLYDQFSIDKREIFKDELYTLTIFYNDDYLNEFCSKYSNDEGERAPHFLEGKIKHILDSHVCYFYNDLGEDSKGNIKSLIIDFINKRWDMNANSDILKQSYLKVIKNIAENIVDNQSYIQYILAASKRMIDILMDIPDAMEAYKVKKPFSNGTGDYTIRLDPGSFSIEVKQDIDIDEVYKLINCTYDIAFIGDPKGEIRPFHNFFYRSSITKLSDGEQAYLKFYASLYEQISAFTEGKEEYILLLDEPESNMHPELARNFVSDLIKFLNDLERKEKKVFQIIISTHSPFILSDSLNGNTIYLTKDDEGNCVVSKSPIKTFASNIHELFMENFFMESTVGEYATNKIKEVITGLNSTQIDISSKDIEKWQYIIDSVGEPIVRNKLQRLFDDRLSEGDVIRNRQKEIDRTRGYEIEESIFLLKQQIKQIEGHINILEGYRRYD